MARVRVACGSRAASARAGYAVTMPVRQIAFGMLAAALSSTAAAGSCATPDSCIAAVARTQDARVNEALARIPGTGAKLVALRSYLRAGPQLAQRWSWMEPQIEAFAGSRHEQELNAAVQGVRREFERSNPGYTLTVNPEIRSLDRQLRAWNANNSVAAAAREFELAATLAIQGAASRQPGITPQAFARFVMDHKLQPSPTLAAPGLSRHGQMYAVDFHVRRGESIVADTDSATISSVWVAQGWEQSLHAAVVASGSPLTGPLREPHEPWHYDFDATVALPTTPGVH
jgi:hypothetical protein